MKNILSLIVGFLVVVLVYSSGYTLQEHQQAIILQLGRIVGQPVTSAGVHLKIPFIQEVKLFEKRILQWDGERGEVPTLDKKFIWVDTTARWRIADALKFYQAVQDVRKAISIMSTILDGATKDVISNHNLIETVRNSNDILEDIAHNTKEAEGKISIDAYDTTLEEITTNVELVKFGREKLSMLIAERAKTELTTFGIELIDVQIRSIAYKEVVEEKVYNRMISERKKIADKILSTGKGETAKILGQLDLSLKKIESEAYRQSQEIRGKAEAEAITILGDALKADPKYYEFVRTLETYKETLTKKGQFILSTDNAFLRTLRDGN